MALTPQQLGNLTTILERRVNQSFMNVSPEMNWGASLCRKVIEQKEKFTYIFYLEWAKLRQKLTLEDPTARKTLLAKYFDISIKYWEEGMQIPFNDIDLDPESQWLSKANELGKAAMMNLTDEVLSFIRNGTTYTAWDGSKYFDNAHSWGATTYDNLLGGDLDKTSLIAAKVAMMRFPDYRGEPMGLIPDTLIISPENEYTAKELVNNTLSNVTDKNTENVLKGIVNRVIVDPRFPSSEDDDWYVACTTAPEKPFIDFQRKGFEKPVFRNNLDEAKIANANWNWIYVFDVVMSRAIHETFPFLMIKTVGA